MSKLTTIKVFNRGTTPAKFITELVAWCNSAPDSIFAVNPNNDIYSKVKSELGPYRNLKHRKAVMLEVLRVLAGFESSWRWSEGVDKSKSVSNTNENAEAGVFQISYDSRKLAKPLADLLAQKGIKNGSQFQSAMKTDKRFAMTYTATLLRHNTKHNGPLYKGEERVKTWPNRPALHKAEESIYPWLSNPCVREFETLIL